MYQKLRSNRCFQDNGFFRFETRLHLKGFGMDASLNCWHSHHNPAGCMHTLPPRFVSALRTMHSRIKDLNDLSVAVKRNSKKIKNKKGGFVYH
jgi:hypothetical protein